MCARGDLLNICRDECQVQYILMCDWGLYKEILLSFNNGDNNTLVFKECRNLQNWYQKENFLVDYSCWTKTLNPFLEIDLCGFFLRFLY